MDWEEFSESPFSSIVGMDPCAAWVLDAGKSHFNRGDDGILIPFIVAFFKGEDLNAFRSEVNSQAAAGRLWLLVEGFYEDVEPGQYFVAFATLEFFRALADPRSDNANLDQLRIAPKHIKLGLPLKRESLPDKWEGELQTPPVASTPNDTVVIGIVDDGIAFAHERFRFADGTTRVHYFWHMDGVREPNVTPTVRTGREIWKSSISPTRKGIDQLLQDAAVGGLVDEDQVYRESGLIDFRQENHKAAAWNRAHGTHVLDLAAGYPPPDAPQNVAIIAVQLPVAATADTSGAGLEPYVTEAVEYIRRRAHLLANGRPEFPVVINFSYGNLAGPHDGTSALEASMDQSINQSASPLSLVLPAGNGHLLRCHAQLVFSEERSSYCLQWRVQPDDLTASRVEIWMPWDGQSSHPVSRVKIRLETPSGLLSPPISEVHGSGVRLVENGEVLLEAIYSGPSPPTERGLFCISMAPTAILQPVDLAQNGSAEPAPAGPWKIHVLNATLGSDEPVEAWIQRDDVIYGYPQRGRQSYFEARSYRRFHPITGDDAEWDFEENAENLKEGFMVRPCEVKRRGMINAIATGFAPSVIGGVFGKELQVVEYSAGGPVTPTRGTPPPSRLGPDAVAVSDDSRMHRGVLAAGSRSGAAALMNGTSVAAPQVARIVADLWNIAGTGDRGAVRVRAVAEEMANPGRPPTQPEIRSGVGRIIVVRPDRPPRIDALT